MREYKRTLLAAVGVVVMLLVGFNNSWSIYAASITGEFGWSRATVSLTFTIHMAIFCLSSVLAGILSRKIAIRYLYIISAGLLLAGFFVSSRGMSPLVLYLGYGLLCGAGSGMCYNSVMNVLNRWYPDKPGLISGLLLMGFGLGGFLLGKLYQLFLPAVASWRTIFWIFGLICFFLVLGAAWILKFPGKQTSGNHSVKNPENQMDLTPVQTLKQSSFWFFFLWAILLSLAGLVIISQARAFAVEIAPSMAEGSLATMAGLVSIFNGIGRIIWGAVFDRLGRNKVMLCVIILFLLSETVLLLALITSGRILLTIAFILIGLSYGGITPTASAFVNTVFGKTHYATNYSLMNMNLIAAAFGGTIAGALYDISGTYMTTCYFMLITTGISLVFYVLIKKNLNTGRK